jgi:hypothetical protein
MTTREETKLSMYNNLASLVRKSQNISFIVPAFGDSVTELNHVITSITSNEITVSKNTDKNKSNKIIAADELIDNLRPVIAALFLFSKYTKNTILRENVNLDEFSLKCLDYASLLDKSNLILQWAKEEINSLLRYGINASHIEKLSASLNKYKKELKTKEADFDGEVAIKKNLIGLFSQADEIIETMDNFAEILRPVNPSFYTQYVELRSTSV